MCGIAGVIYRTPEHYKNLGSDLLSLIQPLETRGPDSSGVAFYGGEVSPSQLKLILRGTAIPWQDVQQWLERFAPVAEARTLVDQHCVILNLKADQYFDLSQIKQELRDLFPSIQLVSAGRKLEIYKEVGAVSNLTQKYGLNRFAGSHGIGHTRMATESIVDTDHCHPFTSSFDLAIVHNGQIANYYKLRFQLERVGMVFETHNDSEAIAHYIYYQLLQGKSLEAALEKLLSDIDGTYTFLVATPDKVGLVRDKFAAKPAVIYESMDKIAIVSEYRALLQLTDFDTAAAIREPDAGEVNVWSVVNTPQETPQMSMVGS